MDRSTFDIHELQEIQVMKINVLTDYIKQTEQKTTTINLSFSK